MPMDRKILRLPAVKTVLHNHFFCVGTRKYPSWASAKYFKSKKVQLPTHLSLISTEWYVCTSTLFIECK